MSVENESKENTTTALAEDASVSTKLQAHREFQAVVADAIKDCAADVKSKLKKVLVEREIDKRVDILDKGLMKLRELKAEMNKIRPADSFTSDGKKVPGNFSKAEFTNLTNAKNKVEKLERALEKAFAGEEFDKLAEAMKGGGKEEKKEE